MRYKIAVNRNAATCVHLWVLNAFFETVAIKTKKGPDYPKILKLTEQAQKLFIQQLLRNWEFGLRKFAYCTLDSSQRQAALLCYVQQDSNFR